MAVTLSNALGGGLFGSYITTGTSAFHSLYTNANAQWQWTNYSAGVAGGAAEPKKKRQRPIEALQDEVDGWLKSVAA